MPRGGSLCERLRRGGAPRVFRISGHRLSVRKRGTKLLAGAAVAALLGLSFALYLVVLLPDKASS